MSIWSFVWTTLLTLAVVGGVIVLVMRSELRREQCRQARRRSHRDTALGKDQSATDTDVAATLGYDGSDVGSGD
ncbi:hypothetical protein [Tropicimonas isoalkanivorans]|uniref:hypothetical protein n=1 Tax=Tropicimonas isoalkanivorans TaxID=441112 RepID=UPI000B891648|nr:hypothetical protein [Tropicimonas isoalkanivorans]